MRLLLDTHIFLWCVKDDRKLSKETRALIQKADEVYVSSASIWESSIKAKLGKLDVDIDQLVDVISASGYLELAISIKHAAFVSKLPELHRDPFDRILIAQAMCEPLRFLTIDKMLASYSDLVLVVK